MAEETPKRFNATDVAVSTFVPPEQPPLLKIEIGENYAEFSKEDAERLIMKIQGALRLLDPDYLAKLKEDAERP